jgi:hypothetical protein
MTGPRVYYLWAPLAMAISLLGSARACALPLPLDAAILVPSNQPGEMWQDACVSERAHWDLELVVPELVGWIGTPIPYGYGSGVHFLRLWWFGPLVPVTSGTTSLQVSAAYAGLALNPLLPYPPLVCFLVSGDHLFRPKPHLLAVFRPPRKTGSSYLTDT